MHRGRTLHPEYSLTGAAHNPPAPASAPECTLSPSEGSTLPALSEAEGSPHNSGRRGQAKDPQPLPALTSFGFRLFPNQLCGNL